MSEEHDSPEVDRRGLAKGRVEALADGIFAVAMTLLVLDIKSPVNLTFSATPDLVAYLAGLEHSFAMYAISFLVLAIFWMAHHLLFHFIRHVDRRLLWLNIFFLLLVTFVPFSTDLIGDHGHLPLPVFVYGINLLALGSLLVAQLRYLVIRPHLATPELTPAVLRHMRRDIIAYAAVPIASMAMAFVYPRFGMYLYLLLVIPTFASNRIDRVFGPGARTRAGSSREEP